MWLLATPSVSGIFVLVDEVKKGEAEPAKCYRQISQFIILNPPSAAYVVEELPVVTNARMALYRQVSEEKMLPIVQIKVNKKTSLGTTYFDAVHPGAIMFPFDPTRMVRHGSPDHRALEKAAREGTVRRMGKLAGHHCPICGIVTVND